jgi:Flp pilus assembly pilin Flp
MINKPPRKSMLRPTLALLRARIAEAKEGATAIEYAMVAAGVGAAVASTVWTVGSKLQTNFYDKIAALF